MLEKFFKVPTLDELISNPESQKALAGLLGANWAQNIITNNQLYGRGEAQRMYDAVMREGERTVGRIYEEVSNIQNAGHDPNYGGYLQNSARSRIEEFIQAWNNTPAEYRNQQPADYLTWVKGTPAIDPYGPGGALANMQGGAGNQAYTSASAPKITEPMVGMQKGAGQVQFVPQSQVATYKAQGWDTVNGAVPPAATTPAATTPAATTPAATQTFKKEIVSDGSKLYAQDETGKLTYIPNEKTLQDFVFKQGYSDTRTSITAEQAQAGSVSASSGAQNASTGASSGQTGGTSASGTTSAATGQIDANDQKWVNDLYQKYFDRTATSSELANWAKENPQALEQFLTKESANYGYTSTYFKDQKNVSYEAGRKKIVDSNLPQDIKDLFLLAYDAYPDGTEAKPDEIINAFNQVKNNTIDPYFKQLSDVAINDIKNSVTTLNQQREQEIEAQNTTAGQAVKQAKSGLEKAGMTFTGQGIEQLGAGSAYAQQATTEGLPAQTPFGGLFYEGSVNQGNRLLASSTASRYQDTLNRLGASAEAQLGSEQANLLGLQGTVGQGIEGTLNTQKSGQYGTTLNDIIANYRAKQEALTNKNYLT